MSIYIGSGGVYDVMVGSDEAQAVYLGATKVWPFTPFNETNTSRSNQPVPANTTGCYVTLIGGGGGGGGGYGAALTACGGGGGGGGGAVVQRSWIPVANLGSTYSVSIGSGGGAGANGTSSSFSSGSVSVIAGGGGKGGGGGSSVAGTAGSAGAASVSGVTGISTVNGTAGAVSNYTETGASASNNTAGGAPGGGAGAGRPSSGLTYAGGKGGDSAYTTGGNGGAGNGFGAGSAGNPGGSASAGHPGAGGGGGGSGSWGAKGGNGGNGGTAGAGGGGGGGGDVLSSGGSGAGGYTRIEWVGQTHPSIKPGPPPAIPSFDAVGSGYTLAVVNASTVSITGTHVCNGNAVIVAVGVASLGTVTYCTASYGGVAMTQLDMISMGGIATSPMLLFGLLNPPSGSQSVVALVGGTSTAGASMTSVSYSDVSSFGSVSDTAGSSASLQQTVSSSAGALIAQAFGAANLATFSLSGYSQTLELSQVDTYSGILQGDAAGAASVDFSASANASVYWAGIAVELLT